MYYGLYILIRKLKIQNQAVFKFCWTSVTGKMFFYTHELCVNIHISPALIHLSAYACWVLRKHLFLASGLPFQLFLCACIHWIAFSYTNPLKSSGGNVYSIDSIVWGLTFLFFFLLVFFLSICRINSLFAPLFRFGERKLELQNQQNAASRIVLLCFW